MNALWSELALARATRSNAVASDEAGQAQSLRRTGTARLPAVADSFIQVG